MTAVGFCGWLPWLDLFAELLGGDGGKSTSGAARLTGAEVCGAGARCVVAVGRTVLGGVGLAGDSVRATGAGFVVGLAGAVRALRQRMFMQRDIGVAGFSDHVNR